MKKLKKITKVDITNKNSYLFDKIYFYFFLFLPFIYSDKIIDPVLIPRQIYLTVFTCILVFFISFKISKKELVNDFSFLKLTLPLLLFVFLILNVLSFIKATSKADSIYVLSKYAIEVLFFVLSTYLLTSNQLTINGLIKAIGSFCIVSLSIALYQALTLNYTADYGNIINQITSTYVNKNLFSSILFLILPFVIGGIYKSKKYRILSIVLLSLIILILIIIMTRAVLIATILSSLIFIFLQKRLILKGYFPKVIAFLIIALGVVIVIYLRESNYFSNLLNSVSFHQRLHQWNNSIQMANDNLILGVGSGNWQFHFPKYGLEKFNDLLTETAYLTYQRPHNDFFWVLCETGIFGLITYVGVFIVALLYILKLLRYKLEPNHEDKILLYGFFSTIIGFAFISFFDFPLERIEHQIVFYLILSIVVAKYHFTFHKAKILTNNLNYSIIKLIFFVLIVFSMIVSINRFTGEFHTRKLYEYKNNGDLNQLVREADESLNAFYVADPTSIPINWYKGVALYTLGNLKEAQLCFEKAQLISPHNIHVLNNLASCYEIEGKHEEAEAMYIKAIQISPRFDEARLNLSAVYYNNKEYEKAFYVIDKVAVTSKDEKYMVYLPVILNSWLGVKLANQKDEETIKKITEVRNSKNKMIEFYFTSKRNKISYFKYILSTI